MATGDKIAAGGIAGPAARAMVGDVATALTAVGSTQATALALAADVNAVSTAAASTGVILPARNNGDWITVANGGANSITVYPPVGGSINGLSANTGVAVATNKAGLFQCIGGTNFNGIVGA